MTPRPVTKRPKIVPKRCQDDLEEVFFRFMCCIDFRSIFGPNRESFWEAFGRLWGVQISHFWHRFLDDFRMSFQERPKSGPRAPKSAQKRPKSGQERPKSGQVRPKNRPRAAKSGPRAAQERPKAAKSDPRAAQERPKVANERQRVVNISFLLSFGRPFKINIF